MKFLKIFLMGVIFVLIKCENLCDKKHENQLIDGLFNVDTTFYAFRKPNLWIINDLSKISNTDITSIPLTQLITGITTDSIQSGFSIIGFTSSDTFNPNGITFVFDGNKYYVSKYQNQTQFNAITVPDIQNIPWTADITGIMKNVLIIESSINAAVYDDINKIVYFFTDNSVDIFPLTENRAEASNVDKELPKQFVNGNGGVMANDKVLFFAENNVWSYTDQGLHSLNQSYWQFFQCDLTSDSTAMSHLTEEANESRKSRKKSEQEFSYFRKSLLFIMIALLILITIIAIMITIATFISFKNSEPNKNKINEEFGESVQSVRVKANEDSNKVKIV